MGFEADSQNVVLLMRSGVWSSLNGDVVLPEVINNLLRC